MSDKINKHKVKKIKQKANQPILLQKVVPTKQQITNAEKNLAIISPQVIRTLNLIDMNTFSISQEFLKAYNSPLENFAKELQAIGKATSFIADYAQSMAKIQQKIINDAIEPMLRLQESIKQATNVYSKALESISSVNFKYLEGLVIDLSIIKSTVIELPKIRTVYDYDSQHSNYNFENAQLNVPLTISKESKTEQAILLETRQISVGFRLFSKEIAEENKQLREQNLLQSQRIDKLEEFVKVLYLNGASHSAEIVEITPATNFTKLLVKMSNGQQKTVSFNKSEKERIVLECLYHKDIEKYEVVGEDTFNNTTREHLTTDQIVDASDRINYKVYAETGRKEFIKIIKRQDIQLNPDF